MRRYPYEGMVLGPALVLLAVFYAESWPQRIAGVVSGSGVALYSLRVAAELRKAQQAGLEPRDDVDDDDE